MLGSVGRGHKGCVCFPLGAARKGRDLNSAPFAAAFWHQLAGREEECEQKRDGVNMGQVMIVDEGASAVIDFA